jgi:hypothetical protein
MEWEQRVAELHRQAAEMFGYRPSWESFVAVVWMRLIPEAFPADLDRRRLESTPEYAAIAAWRDELRSAGARKTGQRRPKHDLSVITVRLPPVMHEVLSREAADRRVSLNELCLQRLLKT